MNKKNIIAIIIFLIIHFPVSTLSQVMKKGQTPPPIEFYNYKLNEITRISPDHLQGNVYLIDFWATWCAPCIEFIPHLNKLVEKYKDKKNIHFISVTYERESIVIEFLTKHPMNSLVGLDTSFHMFREFNGWAIPNIVMINSNGVFAGRIHPNKLDGEVISALLNGKIPDVKNTPEDLYKPDEAEKYFRSLLK